MKKTKIGIIFGGMSTENEVSVVSGTSILSNIDKEKYEIYPIYIDKKGKWYKYLDSFNEIKNISEEIKNKEKINNIVEYLKQLEIVFPVLHGLYGEDGTIQGLLELLKIPYIGCGILASSIGMDKVYTKIIFKQAQIKQAKYVYIRKIEENKYIRIKENFEEEELKLENIEKEIKYPMYIKPSNSGSSVGISKVINKEELKKAIKIASIYDNKILIEEEIKGKEIECAILGEKEILVSSVGEIKSAEEFYTYEAKYKNSASKIIIPAQISEQKTQEIQKLAIKAFKAIDGKGIARVDFFIKEETKEIYINEINTMPGFTKLSMYPKLFKNIGIQYKELINKLIESKKR